MMLALARYRSVALEPSGAFVDQAAKVIARYVPAPPADGTVGQLVSQFISQAKPVVIDEILPIVTRDPALQKNLGTAAGHAIGDRIAVPVAIATVAVVGVAGLAAWKMLT